MQTEGAIMEIAEVHQVESGFQIGGGAGFVTAQVREAQVDARAAMAALTAAGNDIPVIGPHPHEAALAAAREAVIHLNEALSVEAPEDALIDTRHALEELTGTIAMLERIGQGYPVRPGDPPAGRFERALGLLIDAEHKLMQNAPTLEARMPAVIDPNPGIVGPDVPVTMGNGGIVPPWLQQ